MHTFAAESSAVVTAEFVPTDPTAYLPSTAPGRTVAVGASVPTLTLTGMQLWGWWQAGARYGSVSDGAALEVASGAALLLEASAALPGGREPTGTLRIAVDGTEWPTGVALLEVERRTYAVTVSFDSNGPGHRLGDRVLRRGGEPSGSSHRHDSRGRASTSSGARSGCGPP